MNTAYCLRKLALFLAHPLWLAGIAVCGAFIVAYSLACGLPGRQTWTSALVGLGIGSPVLLLTKRLVGKNIRYYADFSLLVASDALDWAFWKVYWKNLLIPLPLLSALGAIGVLAWYLGIPYAPAIGILITLSILGYPEQREVYRTAKEKLAEMNNG